MVDILGHIVKGSRVMGLVLWIDENTFSTNLVEKVFKKRGLPFYGLDSVNDFGYLVADLRPEVIVLEVGTALANLEALKKQYEEFKEIPFILIGESSELTFIIEKLGELKRPIDPFQVPTQIQQLLHELN